MQSWSAYQIKNILLLFQITEKRIIYNMKRFKRCLYEADNTKNFIQLKQRKDALLQHLYRCVF
jgi:exopolyphosphatase/pppGpp-phosphohydrolase